MEWVVRWDGMADAGPFPNKETAEAYAASLREDFPISCEEIPPVVLPASPSQEK